MELADVKGYDAILHLAGLSNDPLGYSESEAHCRNQPPTRLCGSPSLRLKRV